MHPGLNSTHSSRRIQNSVSPFLKSPTKKKNKNHKPKQALEKKNKTELQLIAHLVSFGPHEPADEKNGVGFAVLDQEDEGVVSIEELGVPHLLPAVDVSIVGVPFRVPFESSGVEDVGQVKIFLARDL